MRVKTGENIIYFLFFLSCFTLEIPNILEAQTVNIAYLIAFCVVLFRILLGKITVYKPILILGLSLVVFSLLSILLSGASVDKVIRFFKFISFLIFFYYGYSTRLEKLKIINLINFTFLTFYLVILIQNFERIINAFFIKTRILNISFFNFEIESGNVTPTFFILVATYLYMNKNQLTSKIGNKIFYFNLIMTLLIVLTSYSRTAILLLLFIVLSLSLYKRSLLIKIRVISSIILLFITLLLVQTLNIFDFTSTPLFERFEYTFEGSRSGRAFDDSTMGRVDTIKDFLNAFSNSPILGSGFDRPQAGEFSSGYTSAHNGFISYLYKMGLLNLILYLSIIISITAALYKDDKRYLIILVFVLLGNLPQELFNYISFYEFYFFIIGYELTKEKRARYGLN
jgi:O-antigen ligase